MKTFIIANKHEYTLVILRENGRIEATQDGTLVEWFNEDQNLENPIENPTLTTEEAAALAAYRASLR